MNLFLRLIEKRIETCNSKVPLFPTNKGPSYCHSYSNIQQDNMS